MVESTRNPENLAAAIGAFGVYLFGVAAFLSSAASNVALGLLTLALLLDWKRSWAVLRTDPTFWLIAAFLLYLICSLVWAWPPEWRLDDLDGAGRLLKLWLFLPLAYWLSADQARIERFLLAVLASFLVGRIAAIDWSTPLALATGARLRLGISSINHFGLYSGTMFLGTAVYASTVWKVAANRAPPLAWSLRVGWVLIGATGLYWLLASESRGAAGALILALLFAAGIGVRLRRKKISLIGLAYLGAVIAATTLVVGAVFIDRLSADSSTFGVLFSGNWSDIPYSSTGVRIHMLRLGWEWWLERPWLGYGAGSVERLLDGAAPELHRFKHLHNTLIDNLVRLGAIGTLLLQALFVYLFLALWRGARSGDVPFSLGIFALGSLVYAFIFGLTDYRMGAWDWRHYWLVLGGVSYAVPLAARVSPRGVRK